MKHFENSTMTSTQEKRSYRRLPLRLPFSYQPVSQGRCASLRGVTDNISTGGLYFRTASDSLRPGDLLSIELEVSDNDRFFPSNSVIQARGEVIHVSPPADQDRTGDRGDEYGIGLRFCDELKLVY